jgi:carboxypeptidase Taq
MELKYDTYVSTMQRIADVEHSIAVLNWDKEVNKPKKGADVRARQIATLSGIAHEMFTNDEFGLQLKELHLNQEKLSPKQFKNICLTLKEYKKTKKLSKEFVERKSKVTSSTYEAWIKAREVNDFGVYKDALKEMISIKREEANLKGWEEHPYDALLDDYEPGFKSSQLDTLFISIRDHLVNFAKEIRSKAQIDDSFLHKFYQKEKQWNFGLSILKNLGYDFEAGQQNISTHPFTTSFGATDVRVTTRIDEHNFGSMTWSCIHEAGHGLYEQGLPIEEYGLPLGKAVSLGIHESQSRLWENNVGRSLPFWKAHYLNLQNIFPGNLKSVNLQTFYKAINKIIPSLIRTESDELHYHFHVLIRYEIEKALLEGTIEVENLNEIWNEKYKEYLGIDVPDAKNGILQDIHWALGLIGYFPTYSLGSFYAAQFFNQAKKDIPNLLDKIEKGKNQELLLWLRENIHVHGQYYTANELCEKITGETLNFKYFMEYIKEKYAEIY